MLQILICAQAFYITLNFCGKWNAFLCTKKILFYYVKYKSDNLNHIFLLANVLAKIVCF
jgi:hypothetical protein